MKPELEKIQKMYDELRRTPTPLGFDAVAEDIFVNVDQYNAYIAGYISRVLHGERIDPKIIDLDENLDKMMKKAMEGLVALIEHKNRATELARLLISYLENSQ